MIKIFSLTFLFVCLFSCGQNTPNANPDLIVNKDSIAYIKKCITFIKEVNQEELTNTNFILADKPFSFEYFDCITDLLSDTVTYTKDELYYIKDKKYPSLTKWTKELSINIKLVSSDTIDAIFKDGWWDNFYKKIGYSFNTFSTPIFLRNDTYCLFYSDHHCGSLCGNGQLTLYKKEKNKWVIVKTYCNWVS